MAEAGIPPADIIAETGAERRECRHMGATAAFGILMGGI
jgi:hypothetical protein